MRYRRANTPEATYFFTVVTHERRPILRHSAQVDLLHLAFQHVMQSHPFTLIANVILPEHIHSMWILPENDSDYSTRWRLIKSYFTKHYEGSFCGHVTLSREKKKEQGIWQRRFWEHQIRNEEDYARHVEYIHYNPVKHQLVKAPKDWPYSTFHVYVERGEYDWTWGSTEELRFALGVGME